MNLIIMRLPYLFSLFTASALLLVGCDGLNTSSPNDTELGNTAINARGLSTANGPSGKGAATIAIGTDVSVWDSNFDDPDATDGIAAIGGSGQINGEFTVAERNGIQIALRAQERFEGTLEASGKKIGVYKANTGTTRPEGSNNATWNYDWHVDLRGTETTLADYDLTLHLTSIANEIFGFKTPVDFTFGGSVPYNVVLYQGSWNPGFGNDEFYPTVEGTYNLRLRLSPKAGGPPLSATIKVRVSDPS